MFCLLVALTLSAGSPALDHAAFLSGNWVHEEKGMVIEEVWLPPKGGTMIGVSRTTRGERTLMWEVMRLSLKNGKLVFTAQPNGAAPVDFLATSVSADELVFENPGHDSPNRITYRRQGADAVLAIVEGREKGKRTSFELRYRRVATTR